MPLTDDEMGAMTATLRNKTQLGRFTAPEVAAVLMFMETEGMLNDPHPPEVVTVPREELEEVKPEFPKWTDTSERPWQMVVDDLNPPAPADVKTPFQNFTPQPTETPLYEPFPAKPVV